MATKKKSNKKQTRKETLGKKAIPAKKSKKSRVLKSTKKPAQKRAPVKMKAGGTKASAAKTGSARKKQASERPRSVNTMPLPPETREAHLGRQSGDLQGVSGVEGADSESVDELLEEGNTYEAGVVGGVEAADDADEKEVRTREVAEDDVPAEYLDKE